MTTEELTKIYKEQATEETKAYDDLVLRAAHIALKIAIAAGKRGDTTTHDKWMKNNIDLLASMSINTFIK